MPIPLFNQCVKYGSLILACCITTMAFAQKINSPKTVFSNETGVYSVMLQQLENDLLHGLEKEKKILGGKERNGFVRWIRDHVHVMEAMKYIYPDMTSFIEFYLQNQTSEGLYFDYYYPLGIQGISDRVDLFDQRYWKLLPDDSIQMHRLPVEADLEYLLVEGVYAAWQSTGDTAFVKKWLPALIKGINYSMKDPLRWSKKYNLIKRGYTLDTWDFMQLPLSRQEYTRRGGNVQKGIFNIDEHTPMGIMHGDNSGLYAACNQLANMFTVINDVSDSKRWAREAAEIKKRTNDLCWNGKFYAHFIEDDPQPSYLKMDQKNTLSLSNPYDINRGLPTSEMAQSIINSYKELKETNKANSFAEWYGVYPPVEPDFADYKPGSYMNGGVNTIVAGELARAAFQNGFEDYGVDILQRLMELMKKYHADLPVAYTPEGKVDEGIPDNWGQSAVYTALVEGLAGVVDKSSQFKKVEVSPRWIKAGKEQAGVTITYGPTGAYLTYTYSHDLKNKKIILKVEGNIQEGTARILLPGKSRLGKAWLNGKGASPTIEIVNQSKYVIIKNWKGSHATIEVSYQ